MFPQVSWYWKSLAELDQLWMLKCLRFNWYINFSPTPFEQGIWKKHYIHMVRELHVTKPKASLRRKAVANSRTRESKIHLECRKGNGSKDTPETPNVSSEAS